MSTTSKKKTLHVQRDPGDHIPCPNKTRQRGRCMLNSPAKTKPTLQHVYQVKEGHRAVWGRVYRCGSGHEYLIVWTVDPSEPKP